MAFNINDIKSQLQYGGASPALFQVRMTFPGGLTLTNGGASSNRAEQKISFMCKAAQIPSQTVGVITVPYFGRQLKVAGNRTFEDWTVTVINDEDFLIRATLEEWNKAINSHEGNLRSNGATSNPNSYKGTAEVWQYSKAEGTLPIRKYVFEGIFPSTLAAIDLNWETEGIQEFTTTFSYDYWEITEVETAPPVG
jgi:hypothetical protein